MNQNKAKEILENYIGNNVHDNGIFVLPQKYEVIYVDQSSEEMYTFEQVVNLAYNEY